MADRSSEENAALREALAAARLRRLRGRPMRRAAPAIGAAARAAIRPLAKRGGSPLSAVKARWSEIAGERLAKVCRPEKITGGTGGRVLVLRVIPAAAPLVQHQAETIRQRVSVAAGGDVVSIKILQGPLPRTGVAPSPKPRRTLDADERERLEARAAGVAHPRLKAAILALGAAMLTRPDQV